jgi:hypothetical protein
VKNKRKCEENWFLEDESNGSNISDLGLNAGDAATTSVNQTMYVQIPMTCLKTGILGSNISWGIIVWPSLFLFFPRNVKAFCWSDPLSKGSLQ